MRKALKPAVFVAALFPASYTAWQLWTGRYIDPIAQGMNALGFCTLTFLTLSLACTPAKIVFKISWPLKIRRMLGLFCFFYAALHFLFYLILDQELQLSTIAEDIGKRPFITVGFLGFLLLVPLALTSFDAAVQRLGFHRWKALHRIAYVVAVLGVLHFFWRVKADFLEPAFFAGCLLVFFIVRIIHLRPKSRSHE